jgi:hypothetical protein
MDITKEIDRLIDPLEDEANSLRGAGEDEAAEEIEQCIFSIRSAAQSAVRASARVEARRDAANGEWIEAWSRQVLGLPLSVLSGS